MGKHVAGTLPEIWSYSPSCAFLRNPCGPSAMVIAGMPRRGTGALCQKSEPRHSAAFSSSVSAVSWDRAPMRMCAYP